MLYWMAIKENVCYGSLATATLLQLTNKTGSDVVGYFPADKVFVEKTTSERASAYGIEANSFTVSHSEFKLFEMAIDHFRRAKLMPLLEFYNLAGHENPFKAKTWLFENDSHTIGYAATKPDLPMPIF